MKKILIAVVLAAAFRAASAEQGDWDRLTVQWTGAAQSEKLVIQDDKAWDALWKDHVRDSDSSGQKAPGVDFSRYAVLGVFTGSQGEGDVRTLELRKIALSALRTRIGVSGNEDSSSLQAQKSGLRIQEMVDSVASIDPNKEFDGAGSRGNAGFQMSGNASELIASAAVPAVYVPSAGGILLEKAAAKCTPGVDCPEEKPKSRAQCTPGVDCPEKKSSAGKKKKAEGTQCTPGVDCQDNAGSTNCTPGVDCPGGDSNSNNGGSTPAPPNYTAAHN